MNRTSISWCLGPDGAPGMTWNPFAGCKPISAGCAHCYAPHHHHDDRCGKGIDWVIIGGESGSHARPMRVEWMRALVRQCREAGVATWVKQLGARPVFESVDDLDDETWRMLDAAGWQNIEIRQAVREGTIRLRDRAGADMAEWPSDLRVREMPASVTHEAAGPAPASTAGTCPRPR